MTGLKPWNDGNGSLDVCFFVALSFTGGAVTVGNKCRRYEQSNRFLETGTHSPN